MSRRNLDWLTANCTGTLLRCSADSRRMKPRLRAMSRFIMGPAKQAVMAMLLSPRLAMAEFVDRSPIELPHARTVSPKTS